MNRELRILALIISTTTLMLSGISTAWGQTVSEKARSHMNRGMAAIESAKTPEDFDDAANEFEAAVSLAPNWADPYYNLGVAQDKAGKYNEAIKSLNKYLELMPNARDAEQVRALIDRIGYRKDKAEREQSKYRRIEGTWELKEGRGEGQYCYEIRIVGDIVEVEHFSSKGRRDTRISPNPTRAVYDGKNLRYQYIEDQTALVNEHSVLYTVIDDNTLQGHEIVRVIRADPNLSNLLGQKSEFDNMLKKR